MALQFNCQHCNELIISKFLKIGEMAECKKCGEKNTIPKSAEGISESEIKSEHTISDSFNDGSNKQSNSKTIEVSATQSHNANEVIITDIKMKFGSMVEFMVKWVLASIPAIIILIIVLYLIMAILIWVGYRNF
jgi:DNA-directed RNA polymerase subunit M/transcription elongation factor TFIIS